MTLTITDQVMRSPDTARNRGDGTWEVSWLPQRTQLDRNQAVSAMTIAEEVGRIPADAGPAAYGNDFWNLINSLADELGLSGAGAPARVTEPPGLPYPVQET